jgi:chitinase
VLNSDRDWTPKWLDKQAVPFASDRSQHLLFYDDLESISTKVAYAKSNRLGGVSVWSLDLDDLSGVYCMQGEMPLSNTIKECLEQESIHLDENKK